MNNLASWLLIIGWFVIIFSVSIKISSFWVDNLFRYYNHNNLPKKDRAKIFLKHFWKMLTLYTFIGITLGLIIYFLGVTYPPFKAIEKISNKEKAIASFVMSFMSIILFRLIILLDKNKICKKLGLDFIPRLNKNFNYKKQKDYIESLLFSIIFLAIFGTLMSVGVKLIYGNSLQLDFQQFSINIDIILALTVFVLVLFIVTFAVELMLEIFGVHEEYLESYEE
jgi:hypothetical protein